MEPNKISDEMIGRDERICNCASVVAEIIKIRNTENPERLISAIINSTRKDTVN